MAAKTNIPRRRLIGDERDAARRREGELRLARYSRTRETEERDALIERYLPLARSLAARYRHTSESFDDLVQVAALGLMKAIERYDPSRGFAFSSFAVPTILGELRRHLRDHSWSIRVPRDLQELGQRVTRVSDELVGELGRSATVPELAARLGIAEEAVLDARQAIAAHSPASLDERLNAADDTGTLGDLIGADDTALKEVEDTVVLEAFLRQLPGREREILRLRFQEDLKQRDIGDRLGISQMHVSRLIRHSLDRLHAIAESARDT